MEKGRRFGSAEEFRGREKRALPLAVFLSFNERDVHPHCPNASNPYHKCGRYCLDKIPNVKGLFLDGESSGGSGISIECEKMERKGATPTCPNASNIYHKCAEYCFEKIKHEDAIKEPEKNKGVLFTADKSGVNTKCKHSSNPYHRCDEFCLKNYNDSDHPKDVAVMKPKEQKIAHIADRRVSSHCKYASNPYHVCADYCFQEFPERGQTGQGTKLNSPKEKKKMEKNTDITSRNPHCKNASNPYHKCADYCFKKVEVMHKSDGAQVKEKRNDPPKERKADHPVEEKGGVEAPITSHNHTDSSKGISIYVGAIESDSVLIKEEKEEVNMKELLDSQPLRIDATDLFKEWAKYCSLKANEANEDNEANKGKTVQRR